MRHARWLQITLALVVAVSSCSEAPPDSTEPPPTVDVVVTAGEWRFAPARITSPAGTTITVELRNEGSVVHNWTVVTDVIAAEPDYRDDLRIAGVAAEPGGIARLTFVVPPAGEYQIICTIPGHFSAGMAGTLVATGP